MLSHKRHKPVNVAAFMQCKFASYEANPAWINLKRLDRLIHRKAELLIRSRTGFLEQRIHIAAAKIYIGIAFTKLSVDIIKVAAKEMVNAYGKQQHDRRSLRQTVNAFRDTVDSYIL